MEDDNDSTTTNARQEVDLTLLDGWIDHVNEDDLDAEAKPSFERLLRRCQQTHIQKLISRKAVQSRIKTFRPLTYFCKPAALSPLVCARFGWTNTALNMLKCESCKAVLVVHIHPKITRKSTVTKLILAFQTKLATAHKMACPFRLEAELHLLPTDKSKTSGQRPHHPHLEPLDNLVPPHFATILPRDVWDMMEQPDPKPLVLKRFDLLSDLFRVGNHDTPRDGVPPPWQFPHLNLPKDVLEFGGDTDTHKCDEQHQQQPTRPSSLQNRILAKLAFHRKKHDPTLQGVDEETLLSRVDEVLHPRTEDKENRVQTRAQGAWESLYEGIAALTLFGWMPNKDGRLLEGPSGDAGNDDDDVIQAGCSISLHCPICLSSLHFKLQPYDVHHRLGAAHEHGVDGQGSPAKKRRRLHESQDSKKLNPLLAHRHHCPYVCGFPKGGERKGTPIWVSIASKLFSQSDDAMHNDDESGMDHLLHLLQSGVASSLGGHKIKNSALAC